MAKYRLIKKGMEYGDSVLYSYVVQRKVLWFWWEVYYSFQRGPAEYAYNNYCTHGVHPYVRPNEVIYESCEDKCEKDIHDDGPDT